MAVRPDMAPPKNVPPSALFAELLSRGRPPFLVVDFPRFDEAGEPIAKVHVRLLTVREEDLALANARKYVSEQLRTRSEDLPWRPEELEHNARVTELLAVACRDAEDPSKPFFPMGVIDLRQHFTAEEIGVLAAHYAELKSRTHPRLREMTEEEMDEWLRVIAEGAMANPFAFFSVERLQTLCEYAARCLAEKVALSTGPNPTPSSSSES